MKVTKWDDTHHAQGRNLNREEWNDLDVDPTIKSVYVWMSGRDIDSFEGYENKFPNAEEVTIRGTHMDNIKGFPFTPSRIKKLELEGSLKSGHYTLHFPYGMDNLEELLIDDAVIKIENFPKSVKKLKMVTNATLKALPRSLPNLEHFSKRGVGAVNNLGVWDARTDPVQKLAEAEILEGNDAKYLPKAPKLEYLGIDDDGWGGSEIYDFSAMDYPNIKKARIDLYGSDPDFPNLNLYDIEELSMKFPHGTRDLSGLPYMPSLRFFRSWHAKNIIHLDDRAPNVKDMVLSYEIENGEGIPESVERLSMVTDNLTSLKGVPRKHFIQMVDDVLYGKSKIDDKLRRVLFSCKNQIIKNFPLRPGAKTRWGDGYGDYPLERYAVDDIADSPLCEKAYYTHNILTEDDGIASVRCVGCPESEKRYAIDFLKENYLCEAYPKLIGVTDERIQRKLTAMGRLYKQKCGGPYG